MTKHFNNVVTTAAELRGLYRKPSALAGAKEATVIDAVTASFIARSPFVIVATTNREFGRGDVSPKGGPAGFVKVLDQKRLVIPDYNGNNRVDGLGNLLVDPAIGLLFLVPGVGETLRINGQGYVTTDPGVLDLFTHDVRRPKAAIGVQVSEVMLHCAKAALRSKLWEPEEWGGAGPSAGELLVAHSPDLDRTAAEIDGHLERGYAADLAEDNPPERS
ncbi:MAG: pyridoxamine 5'-phosphate oxidase family protein [Actinomycetia bacterium]|nr:pyridoxamine 5'-phosphate oxidase family protein [Actinomycetes bacterium]MCP4960073.1 pyridoxamine 5'-phosphate oxidase family protein [Actinomycetes bacterium]